jgi:hypothetical protein
VRNEKRGSDWPLAPPRPNCAAPQRPCAAVQLRGGSLPHGLWPRHALPRPGCTAQAAPRHPGREFVPCCALGRHASALTPALRCLLDLAAGVGTSADGSYLRVEARGVVLLAMPQGISIADVSVIHPNSLNTLSQAEATAGAAALHRDGQKQTAYARAELNG